MLIENQSQFITDDAAMVIAAQENPAEFKQLYQKWLKPVYRYFYFRLGNEKDAEDLTSQVFLKVYEDLPRYRNRGCFSAWLFSIAHARAVDFYRRNSRQVSFAKAEIEPVTSDLLSQTIHSYELKHLLALIDSLSEAEQEMLRLRFMAELSYREIGLALHRSEEAVRKSLSRLYNRLQVEMETRHE